MSEIKKQKKKRKSGTGQIEILPSGSVRIKVTVIDVDGQKRIKSFTGKTLKEAERCRDDYQEALEDAKEEGEFYFKRFEDAVNIWLYDKKVIQLSEASFKRLKSTFFVNIIPFIGRVRMDQIDSSRLQKLINSRLNDLSYSSTKKIYDGLNNFYKWTVDTRKMAYNRMTGVELPKRDFFAVKTKQIEVIPDDKIETLIEVALSRCNNGKLKFPSGPAIVFLLYTGLRLGELLALEWSDIDFKNGKIRIWKTLVEKELDQRDPKLTREERILLEKGRRTVFKIQQHPKSNASKRVLKLHKNASEMLELLKDISNGSTYVVGTKTGGFRLPSNFERTFKVVLSIAGIKEMGVHSTRHTFATRLIRTKKVALRVISKILGHESEKVTRDTYIHICQEELDELFDVVEDMYEVPDRVL